MDSLEYVMMSRRRRQRKIRTRRRLILIVSVLIIMSVILTAALIRCGKEPSSKSKIMDSVYPIEVDDIPVTTRLLPEG